MEWETLNVRIINRNDTSANWNTNKAIVLSKGEIGIEFLTSGKAMIKIGDGITSWEGLKYLGNTVDTGTEAPAPSLIGEIGTIYIDTVSNKLYVKTVSGENPWKQILTTEDMTAIESGLMTSDEKAKLAGINAGAEVNVQADWNETDTTSDAYIKNKPTTMTADGGNADTISGKSVDDTKETEAYLWTAAKAKAYADAQVNAAKAYSDGKIADAIGGITMFDIQVVDALPESGVKGIIYLVSSGNKTGNIYDEYIWIPSTSKYEKIGSTDMDLSGYVTTESLPTITVGNSSKVNNHTVDSNVPVDAVFTDTTYAAGDNINIDSGNKISVGTNVLLKTDMLILNGGNASS